MPLRKLLVSTVMAAGLLTLAACDSSEQRAEKYYQSGMAYLQQGDVDQIGAIARHDQLGHALGGHALGRVTAVHPHRSTRRVGLDRGDARRGRSPVRPLHGEPVGHAARPASHRTAHRAVGLGEGCKESADGGGVHPDAGVAHSKLDRGGVGLG